MQLSKQNLLILKRTVSTHYNSQPECQLADGAHWVFKGKKSRQTHLLIFLFLAMVSLARRGTSTKNSLQLHLECCDGTNANISAGPSVSTFPYIKHCFRGPMATQLSFSPPTLQKLKTRILVGIQSTKEQELKKEILPKFPQQSIRSCLQQ